MAAVFDWFLSHLDVVGLIIAVLLAYHFFLKGKGIGGGITAGSRLG